MKTIWFHMQGYRDLPDDFRDRYESIWVTPPNDELCHSPEVAKYLHWNLDELEMADALGFDGLGLNEHHQNGYGFPISPDMIATVLARRKSNAALVILGNTLPLYSPPIRVAEEFALLDCLSGGRLVAGFPVGSPMDTTGCYGIPPTQVRPRYYEAHDLIKQAWTRPGPFAFNGRFNKLRYVNPWPKPETAQNIELPGGFAANPVIIKGEGAPVVYLHGPFGQEWDGFLDDLAAHRRVYAPAHAGAEETEDLEQLDGLSDLILYYDDLFDRLGLERVDLIGHSFGGMVAADDRGNAYVCDPKGGRVLIISDTLPPSGS